MDAPSTDFVVKPYYYLQPPSPRTPIKPPISPPLSPIPPSSSPPPSLSQPACDDTALGTFILSLFLFLCLCPLCTLLPPSPLLPLSPPPTSSLPSSPLFSISYYPKGTCTNNVLVVNVSTTVTGDLTVTSEISFSSSLSITVNGYLPPHLNLPGNLTLTGNVIHFEGNTTVLVGGCLSFSPGTTIEFNPQEEMGAQTVRTLFSYSFSHRM